MEVGPAPVTMPLPPDGQQCAARMHGASHSVSDASIGTDSAACKGLRYSFGWRDLRVKAEDKSNEVLKFACSFGVGEGTRRPNWTDVCSVLWYNSGSARVRLRVS